MHYFDIIGDIHGHADELEALLQKLGYRLENGTYRHPEHQAMFLGDFIDRGPHQRRVIDMVRPMIEQGAARSVMGNHEFNAICYGTNDADGNPLREHSKKNRKQHQQFLDAYPDVVERKDLIEWFMTLPVYIETDGVRVVHACWNEPALQFLKGHLNEHQCLRGQAYAAASIVGSPAFEAIETVLKGPEVNLPTDVTFLDKDGHERSSARIKWWAGTHLNAAERLNLGDQLKEGHKLEQLEIDDSYHYPSDHKPVFVGHYWLMQVQPELLSENCACLDYSVARGGKLVAYSWRGESSLTAEHFVWCE